MTTTENPTGTCADVCQHLDEPERRPLLVRVDRKTDKDTEIMPLLHAQMQGVFLPQSVPFYAATQNFLHLHQTHPQYSYKEATLNPTNPRDRATCRQFTGSAH